MQPDRHQFHTVKAMGWERNGGWGVGGAGLTDLERGRAGGFGLNGNKWVK